MQTIKHLLRRITNGSALSTPLAIILAALILGGSHVIYGIVASSEGSSKVVLFNGKDVDTKADLVTGKTDSKVVIVEYSDTECPFCAQLHPTMKKLQEEYASKVAFAYRYFPLTQIHPHAFDEARAIFCVGKVSGASKREQYIDTMFTYKFSKKNMVLPEGMKETFAKNIGVDQTAFASCMSGAESSQAVNDSLQDGVAAGVQGTPATFILLKTRKGYEVVSSIDGARPYEYIKAAVEEALTR